mgnify:CR=1 FL=1
MKSDKNKTTKAEKRQPVGRPKKNIDIEILANLSQIGCTQEEIGGVMGVSARTLQRNYAEIIEQNKNKGRASLRKKMWEKALKKDSTHMQIWLSKNELNMRDKVETQNITEPLPLIIEAEKVDG